MATCPDCGSEMRMERYEEVDRETGYRDCGERFTCTDCASVWGGDELERLAREVPTELAIAEEWLRDIIADPAASEETRRAMRIVYDEAKRRAEDAA